jgi:hypothetical protein
MVHRAASAFIGGVMRHIPHDVETGFKGMLGSRSGNFGVFPHQHPRLQSPRSHPEGKETVMPAPEATHDLLNSCGEPETAGVRQDEEDGWVSDRSWSEDAPMGYRQSAKHHHSRLNKRRHTDRHHSSIHAHHHSRLPLHHHSRLPFHHHSRLPVHHHSRLPLHVPMGISTSTAPAAGSPKLAPDEVSPSSMVTVDEETRGRRLPASTPSTPERLPRDMRILSLRGSATSSREVSPVRSIRWGAGASPATVRWPQSPCASARSSRAPSPGPSTPGEPIEPDLG